MSLKQTHDASAYIRSLAQLRGRNVEWAEKAVREAVSLSADEALRLHVVDHVAADVSDLLKRVQGTRVSAAGTTVTIDVAGAELVAFDPDWRTRLLFVIASPSLALLLMMLGVYGLLFEFSNPGYVLPGVVGGICLLLGLFALQMLPFNDHGPRSHGARHGVSGRRGLRADLGRACDRRRVRLHRRRHDADRHRRARLRNFLAADLHHRRQPAHCSCWW